MFPSFEFCVDWFSIFQIVRQVVDLCVKSVIEAGYEVFMGPKDIVIPSSPELKARMAFCYGPLGEEIEFFHEY